MTIDTITQGTVPVRVTTGRSFATQAGSLLIALAVRIAGYAERRRSRLALLEMTDDQLKDIGVSRADAWNEGCRSVWDRL
jgi:uncharacterized protein YjiS (DUF1127 family)